MAKGSKGATDASLSLSDFAWTRIVDRRRMVATFITNISVLPRQNINFIRFFLIFFLKISQNFSFFLTESLKIIDFS
jgi:hypothetical protein